MGNVTCQNKKKKKWTLISVSLPKTWLHALEAVFLWLLSLQVWQRKENRKQVEWSDSGTLSGKRHVHGLGDLSYRHQHMSNFQLGSSSLTVVIAQEELMRRQNTELWTASHQHPHQQCLMKGHKDDEGMGASLIHGEAKRAGTAQLEGEKAKVGRIHTHKYLIVE